MKVIFLPEVRTYFNKLIPILHEKEYFGFKDAAKKYVDDLFNEIEMDLSIHLHKPAPKYFSKYGKNMEYAGFRKNKNTTWYAFFQKYKDGRDILFGALYR